MSSESAVQFVNAVVPTDKVPTAARGDGRPIRRPIGLGAYQFAVVSALRAGQLLRGCIPRVDAGAHRATVVAQLEVAGGKIEEVRTVGNEK